MEKVVADTKKKVGRLNSLAKLCGNVFYKTAEILSLAGVGAWLIYSSDDIVTIGVGVTTSLWSLVKLVNLAYCVESCKNIGPR